MKLAITQPLPEVLPPSPAMWKSSLVNMPTIKTQKSIIKHNMFDSDSSSDDFTRQPKKLDLTPLNNLEEYNNWWRPHDCKYF